MNMSPDGKNATNTLRDCFWLWGQEAGCHNDAWGLPSKSRMTPAEAAHDLGIPGVMFVRYNDLPAPSLFEQNALALRPFPRVVWSIIGDSQSKSNDQKTDLGEVIGLAERHPNLVGAVMDDFFDPAARDKFFARYSLEEVQAFRQKLNRAKRPLDLYVVLYEYGLDLPIEGHLVACDVITFWTWQLGNLPSLQQNFEKLQRMAPQKRKMLGLYLWAYGDKQPMPVELMEMQCEYARTLLKNGDIEGAIFCANCVCDLNLEAVEWTRRWIQKVGDEAVGGRPAK